MKKLFKVRIGGMFHGTTYMICAQDKAEVVHIMLEQENEIIFEEDVEEVELKESGIIASGEFHWLYHK